MKVLVLTLVAATALSSTAAHAWFDPCSPYLGIGAPGGRPHPGPVIGDGSVRIVRR
ncbi:MAG: hypothetical protein KDK12_17790 [Rhodobacteraceae bacterium]|nr:hypothetical protein [Paracoccaceae bacterium]